MSIESSEGQREALRSSFWQSMSSNYCNGAVWETRAANNHTAARPVALQNRPPGAYKPRFLSWLSACFVSRKVERKQTEGAALMYVCRAFPLYSPTKREDSKT